MKSVFSAVFIAFFAISAPVAMADQDLVTVESANGVKAAADKLEKILKSKGITVFARIDHAAGAKRVRKSLRPTELVIFGNPKLGTPLMESNQTVGIDLPLKALIFEGADGKAYIAYNDPFYIAERHSIGDRGDVLDKIAGALKNIVAAAAKK